MVNTNNYHYHNGTKMVTKVNEMMEYCGLHFLEDQLERFERKFQLKCSFWCQYILHISMNKYSVNGKLLEAELSLIGQWCVLKQDLYILIILLISIIFYRLHGFQLIK